MFQKVVVYDPTVTDPLSKVRGVGRYLQILKENFPNWEFTSEIGAWNVEHGTFINPFFNFLQKPLTMKRVAQRQIAVIHDLIPLKYPKHFPIGLRGNLNVFLNKLALKNYDVIVTDSEASKKDIVKILGIESDKIKIIYPCLPKIFTSSVKPQNPASSIKSPASPYCLYVGDVTWNKNLVNLARAIKTADISCVFVGRAFEKTVSDDPWSREFNEFLNLAKDDKRFILKGFVKDEKLVKLYENAACNILVSRDEGFGFSYLEAASQGCPSVLSGVGVLMEIAADTASFADPNDPDDIAEKIKQLRTVNNLKMNLGEAARKRSQKFSSRSFQKKWNSI